MRRTGPRIGAGDAERGERRGETFEILDRQIECGLVERPEAHWLPEVEAHPAGMRSIERDVAVAKTAADADGGDPVPGTLDPPAATLSTGVVTRKNPKRASTSLLRST